MSARGLAILMGVSPRTIQGLLHRPDCSAVMLASIGNALDHDFFGYLRPPAPVTDPVSYEDKISELEKRMEELLHENELLQREVKVLKEVINPLRSFRPGSTNESKEVE